jgi:hypothetical protein
MGGAMRERTALTLCILLLTLPCLGKDKKKDRLPELIMRAQYVAVVEDPDSGISLADPAGNRVAQRDVEMALEKWGRFKITIDPGSADLVVVVRKANKVGSPTIGGGTRNGPVVMDPSGNGDVRIGTTIGRPPGRSNSDPTWGDGPRGRAEVGPAEDLFTVYAGHTNEPLDSVLLWRYSGRSALQHPGVPAVEKFRKAIEDSEKAKP